MLVRPLKADSTVTLEAMLSYDESEPSKLADLPLDRGCLGSINSQLVHTSSMAWKNYFRGSRGLLAGGHVLAVDPRSLAIPSLPSHEQNIQAIVISYIGLSRWQLHVTR